MDNRWSTYVQLMVFESDGLVIRLRNMQPVYEQSPSNNIEMELELSGTHFPFIMEKYFNNDKKFKKVDGTPFLVASSFFVRDSKLIFSASQRFDCFESGMMKTKEFVEFLTDESANSDK